ncbi:hypothetical protein QCA50_011288 [Cerrena zonata]|uniref:Uncharacterized protein n=1 Tax=Cerrena zonata TaxID=2478898 RepID=A0AAW0FW45_9APHY
MTVVRTPQGFLEEPHRLLTPKSLFPNRVLPNPEFLKDDHFPILMIHHKCEFRFVTPKQKKWGPWKPGFYLGSDRITLPSGHQLRRCLIGRPVAGRYSDNGQYLLPSAERFWLIPALGQVWPEKTKEVDVPEP